MTFILGCFDQIKFSEVAHLSVMKHRRYDCKKLSACSGREDHGRQRGQENHCAGVLSDLPAWMWKLPKGRVVKSERSPQLLTSDIIIS